MNEEKSKKECSRSQWKQRGRKEEGLVRKSGSGQVGAVKPLGTSEISGLGDGTDDRKCKQGTQPMVFFFGKISFIHLFIFRFMANREAGAEISCITLPPHVHSHPRYRHSPLEWYICCN